MPNCKRCGGDEYISCSRCDGTGSVWPGIPTMANEKDECSRCDGTGDLRCNVCDGTGSVGDDD